jgi:hypothetical protein
LLKVSPVKLRELRCAALRCAALRCAALRQIALFSNVTWKVAKQARHSDANNHENDGELTSDGGPVRLSPVRRRLVARVRGTLRV